MSNWPTKKLGEIAEISSGGTPRTGMNEYWDGDVPWLRSGELVDKEIYKTERKITELGLKNSSAKLFPKNSVLIALTGATVGKTGILRIEASTNQSVAAILPNEKFIPEFVWYFLRLNYPKIKYRAYGGAQPHIDQGDIKALKINLPPLEAQKQIVERLDKIAEAEKLNDELIQKSDELFQSLLRKELNPTGKNWEIKKLGEVCEIYQPQTITSNEIKKEGPYKVFGANGVIGYYHKYNHEDSEVLVTCRGATCGTLNFSEPKSWITGNAMVVKPKDKNLTKEFLYYLLIKSNLKKIITGTGQPQITRMSLAPFKISIPPIKIQKQIVAKLSAVQDYKKQLRVQKSKLKELFDSVLHKSMKGELVK